jgi:transcriptional regulator GlxA family with amidase domain
MRKRTVLIYIFDAIEVLDFCGPYEVFTVAGRHGAFEVPTVAEQSEPIATRGGMRVIPDFTWSDCPFADLLVVPGGKGAEDLVDHTPTIDWVTARTHASELTLSVCTGSLLLGKAGLLDGLTATTHHECLHLLRACAPSTNVVSDHRFVDNGKIVTAAGVSAGIDAALYVVERLLGKSVAMETARNMAYPWEGHGD